MNIKIENRVDDKIKITLTPIEMRIKLSKENSSSDILDICKDIYQQYLKNNLQTSLRGSLIIGKDKFICYTNNKQKEIFNINLVKN